MAGLSLLLYPPFLLYIHTLIPISRGIFPPLLPPGIDTLSKLPHSQSDKQAHYHVSYNSGLLLM